MNYEATINHYEQKQYKKAGEKALEAAKKINKPAMFFKPGLSPAWQKMKAEVKARMEKRVEKLEKPKKPSAFETKQMQAISLYEGGSSIEDVMRELDISRSYANSLLNGAARRENEIGAMKRKEEARKMHASGMAVKEISERLNVHRYTVNKYLK